MAKKTIASRLAQLVPYTKEKAQKVKKSFVKKMPKKLKDKGKENALKDKKLSLATADKPAEEEAEQPQPRYQQCYRRQQPRPNQQRAARTCSSRRSGKT